MKILTSGGVGKKKNKLICRVGRETASANATEISSCDGVGTKSTCPVRGETASANVI